MTQFKNALLDELVAYAQRPVPAARPARSRSTQIIRFGVLAGVGATAVVAALLVVPSGQQAAYAVDKNPDGTVTITFREMANPAAATRDLRAAGVRAQVVRLAVPGSCATTPGGTPFEPQSPVPLHLTSPPLYPSYVDFEKAAVPPQPSRMSFTFNPAVIPADAVVFIVEPPGFGGFGFVVNLVRAPAPTCWEADPVSDSEPVPPTHVDTPPRLLDSPSH